MNGTIANATIRSSGDGDVYVLGTNTSLRITSSGGGDVKLRNANGKLCHQVLFLDAQTGMSFCVQRSRLYPAALWLVLQPSPSDCLLSLQATW